MIRIVKASTLAELRAEAAQFPGLRRAFSRAAAGLEIAKAAQKRAESTRVQAEAAADRARAAQAEAEAGRATAEAAYRALFEDTLAGVMRAKTAVSDPHTGRGFQAELALAVIRGQIAAAKASGDPDVISGFRILDALLGKDHLTPVQVPRLRRLQPAHDEISGKRAGCVCPAPYYPGGPVPCAASGRCARRFDEPDTNTTSQLQGPAAGEAS